MFILATTELHKVPATILSRCQRFNFKRILPRDMEKHLLRIAGAENIPLAPDGAEILARHGQRRSPGRPEPAGPVPGGPGPAGQPHGAGHSGPGWQRPDGGAVDCISGGMPPGP